jgi:flagellar export protein FliJ
MTGSAFRFRLERVRAIRERKERIAQQELAEAISRRSSTEAELRAADIRLEHAREQQRTAVGEPHAVRATDLLDQQSFLERVEVQRGMRAGDLAQREAEVADRDRKLTSAAKEHEMLNRLSDRRRDEHDREVARRELGVLDEITTTHFGRSSA